MVKQYSKKDISILSRELSYRRKIATSIVATTVAVTSILAFNAMQASSDDSSAVTCTNASCDLSFEVNVDDSLSVSLTTPEAGATGNVGDFLRNTVNLEVDSNVANGFTASMYSSADNAGTTKTDLTHSDLGDSYAISTLSNSTTRGNFPTDSWGYSLKTSPNATTYGETDAGNNNSYYYPLTASDTSPITVMSEAAGTKSGTQSIYFGAKASANKPSGTYNNTVVISVVTGAINGDSSDPGYNPITPTNPATPGIDTPNDNTATYTGNTGTGATTGTGISGNSGTTVYTTSSRSGTGTAATTTTTTEVSAGDHTSAYTQPHGVQSTNKANIASVEGASEAGTELPAALAAAAAASATTGFMFFILAKRRKDDDEEEEEQ